MLKYGYLWEQAAEALPAPAGSDEIEIIKISHADLRQLIGDLSNSLNKRTRGGVQRGLNDLCDRLESAARYGDGKLDEL